MSGMVFDAVQGVSVQLAGGRGRNVRHNLFASWPLAFGDRPQNVRNLSGNRFQVMCLGWWIWLWDRPPSHIQVSMKEGQRGKYELLCLSAHTKALTFLLCKLQVPYGPRLSLPSLSALPLNWGSKSPSYFTPILSSAQFSSLHCWCWSSGESVLSFQYEQAPLPCVILW